MKKIMCFLILSILLLSCSNKSIQKEEYSSSDSFIGLISSNISNSSFLNQKIEIDHSRLANKEESPLLPTKVVMFNNKDLEVEMLEQDRMLALELPFKILVYTFNNETKIIWNDIYYISKRYKLSFSKDVVGEYEKTFLAATKGIPNENIQVFSNKNIKDNGIITLSSPYDYDTTYEKAMKLIKDNKDVMIFDTIDYQLISKDKGLDMNKTTLIMFGAPKPGGKAMNGSQTLGLDGFPQKLLIWEDENGKIRISYNDLIEMANRQDADKSITLRIIQYRLNNLFPKEFEVVDEF